MRGSRTVRTGIILLAAVGFALSYDALRQMAVAAHIRGPLTYLFPLVIDGFIAIGVVALLILRTAPLHSRLYVWTLLGLATLTSIWANALHAIRLNERTRLHLDNATVGALSAIAPLALAVHLYLVINRHLAANTAVAASPSATTHGETATPEPSDPVRHEETHRSHAAPTAEGSGEPAHAAKGATATPTTDKAVPKKAGRKTTAPDKVLWSTARAIGAEHGTVPRTTLEAAIRTQGYTIQKDRAKEIAKAATAELASLADTNAAA
ncbi:DUF2637 domain-containing protein [Streptomyces gossypii]|uniref:DUF2637 domain-containing protein n=1 Tax=Streptomyces gossypii TaxID=2883101 RepID=UPI0035CCF0D6